MTFHTGSPHCVAQTAGKIKEAGKFTSGEVQATKYQGML